VKVVEHSRALLARCAASAPKSTRLYVVPLSALPSSETTPPRGSRLTTLAGRRSSVGSDRRLGLERRRVDGPFAIREDAERAAAVAVLEALLANDLHPEETREE